MQHSIYILCKHILHKNSNLIVLYVGGNMEHIKGMGRNQVLLFPEVIDDYITEEIQSSS